MTASMCAVVYLRYNVIPAEEEKVEPSESPIVLPTSTPKPTPTPEPEYYTLSFIGDCTLASSQYNNDFDAKLNGDYSYPFKNTVEYFENDDLTFANLECSFSEKKMSSYVTFYFLSPPDYANILTEGGVDFVTTANNHADDFNTQGVEDTSAALDAIDFAHAGENETYILDMDGIKVGVYCLFNKFQPTEALVKAGIQNLKSQGAEYIVCALHWGNEGSYQVFDWETKLAHAAIDAGANVIWGSHPHVLQRVEEYNGGVIMYSMGNWSFGGNTAPRDRDTAIIQVTVKKDIDGTLTTDGYEAIPCCLSSTPSVNDYCPTPYEKDSEEYKRTMSKLDGTWTGADLVVDYSAYHQG